MKKTLIALLALSGMAMAVTYEPFKDTTTTTCTGETVPANAEGWLISDNYQSNVTISSTGNSLTPDTGWTTYPKADYRMPTLLTLTKEDVLTFSFEIDRAKIVDATDNNLEKSRSNFTVALVGTTQAVVFGRWDNTSYTSSATDLLVGTSTNVANATTGSGAHGYDFAGGSNTRADVTASQTLAGGAPIGESTISGSISWSNTGNQYVMTLKSSEIKDKSITYNLGTKADLRDIVFTFNGADTTVVSNMSISMASIPEPTTATLSLLALAGLAARRRRK